MTRYQTGVHTVEVQTEHQLIFAQLPDEQSQALTPKGKNRYSLNITKLPSMGEYNSIGRTQAAIDDALKTFMKVGSGYARVTRIDYRLDNYDDPYAKELGLMTVLVYLIAHRNGLFDRRIHYTDGEEITTSVRAMPDEDDHSARQGIEYYDKARQKHTARYGNARLEFRALNRQGETVSYAVKEWRDMFQSITRKEYQAMLTDRANRLLQSRLQGESPTDFMQRIRPRIIAREEEGILLKLMHHQRGHYYCKTLPNWKALAVHISNVEEHLNQALDA